MKKTNISLAIIFILLFSIHTCHAGLFGNIVKKFKGSSSETPKDDTMTSGLKEILSIGTKNAVKSVSKVNGYSKNQAVKILLPEETAVIADSLKVIGYQKQVDDFILSMNRAAEKAAPKATSLFIDAIEKITFEDAKQIFNGGDTAATEYLKANTNQELYKAFKPIIASKMNETGVTRYYKDMVSKVTTLPFMKSETFDLDHYVTSNALEGLFYMIGEEEKKIRTDPKARVTDLLNRVFEEDKLSD